MTFQASGSLARYALRAALTGMCMIAVACGSARRGEPLATPVVLDQQAERGRAVFMANCHQCHPGGEAGLGPALNDKPFPEFLKKFQVRHGLGTMPSFPETRISDEQLEDLMKYLKALRRNQLAAAALRRQESP